MQAVSARIKEFPGHGFSALNEQLYCSFCEQYVSSDAINTERHTKKRKHLKNIISENISDVSNDNNNNNNNNDIKILQETEKMIKFEWEIKNQVYCDELLTNYIKNMRVSSDIILHCQSQTKWCLTFCPMGYQSKKNTDIFLTLINNPSNIETITVNKTIQCKQLKTHFFQTNSMYVPSNISSNYASLGWNHKNHTFLIANLKNQTSLNFICEIEFVNFQYNG